MGRTDVVGYGECMGLRCETYGVRRGLWDCGVGPVGKSMGMAMGLELWASMGLRCGTHGVRRGLWDCGVGPMGKAMGMGLGLWACMG